MAELGEGGSERGEAAVLASWLLQRAHKRWLVLLLVVFGLAVSVGIRVHLFDFHSSDLDSCGLAWCDSLQKVGLAETLKNANVDYNPTYLYLLWLANKLPFTRLVAIKLCSVIFDYLCALALGLIVYRVHASKLRAAVAAFALLITPTVVFNGALWGQCDMVFVTPMVVALALMMNKRPYLATALFGLAIAVKLQAIFLFPLLGVWVLRKLIPWRSLLLIPGVFLLCLVPAWLSGTSWHDLLLIYPNQTHHYTELTLNAPTIFNLLPNDAKWFGHFGIWLAMGVVFMLFLACVYTHKRTTSVLLVEEAAMFACLTPFLLPRMHERYVFLGDVLSLLYGFLRPGHLAIPLLVLGASFVSYFPYLFGKTPVPLGIASLMLGSASVFLAFDVLRRLYPGAFARPDAESPC